MKLVGANSAPDIRALDELPGKSNYLIGNDPAKWRTNIPLYARVAYEEVYPGIDLIYYGDQGQLECDFVVAPGANPGAIRLGIQGATQLAIGTQGDLSMRVGAGDVHLHRPTVFQESKGIRKIIPARYRIFESRHEVGLQIGPFDNRERLVIDPVLSYSSYLGGSLADRGTSIAAGPNGAVYITGQTFSTAPSPFPTTPGAFQTTVSGASDAFVSKFDTTQSGAASLVYSTYLGGGGDDAGNGIAVDSVGNAYVTGTTSSTDFPIANPLQGENDGGFDAFVTKLSADGSALVYSTYLGGSGTDTGAGIALDPRGIAYLTGQTSSSDFRVTDGAFQRTPGGGNDAFVAKIDTTRSGDSSLLYSTYLGGMMDDSGNGIAVDSTGNAYVTGSTASADFPLQGAFQSTLSGGIGTDAFVTKLKPDGSALIYSTYLGGTGDDSASGIAVGSDGLAYVTGQTFSRDFPVHGAFQGTLRGVEDAFVAKFDTTKTGMQSRVYSSYLGGGGADSGSGIAVDSSGNAYLTGTTGSTDFPSIKATQLISGGGTSDAFVAKVNSAGSALAFSTYMGGSGADTGSGIAVDASGAALVVGSTASTNFPTTANPFQLDNAGGIDAFVAKLTDLKLPVGSVTASLTFTDSQKVNTPSPPQTATLTNTGDADLILAFIALTGTDRADFAESDTCLSGGSGTLPPGASCTISVTFTPKGTGARTASVTITDNAGNSPQTVRLTGTGVAPMISTDPPLPLTLAFGNQNVNTTSDPPKTVKLTNTGMATLIPTFTIGADYVQTNDCGSAVVVQASCTISVTFSPKSVGTHNQTLTVRDADRAGNTATINLTGSGRGPTVNLPGNQVFADQVVGTTSAPKTVILRNTGNSNLSVTRITIEGENSGDFGQSNSCPTTLPMETSCNIMVTFTPSAGDRRGATLTITDNALGSPHAVDLSGRGADFTIDASPNTLSVNAGSNASFDLSLSALFGFQQTVTLTCSGAPLAAICGITPPTVTLAPTGATARVVVLTLSRATLAPRSGPRGIFPHAGRWFPSPWFAWFLFLLALMAISTVANRSAGRRAWLGLAAVMLFVVIWASCGGGGGSGPSGSVGTPAGTYTLTFTAAYGGLVHKSVTTLTVQ